MSYTKVPALNGGLYTGTPFLKGAPWANVPVIPDVDYMTNVNLRSANPPPDATTQYPGGPRPGNNNQAMPGVDLYGCPVACNNTPCSQPQPSGRFFQYAYL